MRRALPLAFPALVALAFGAALVWDGSLLRASWQDVHAGAARRIDPVCGMSVGDGIEASWKGRTSWFCSAHCRDRFLDDPARYRVTAAEPGPAAPGPAPLAEAPAAIFLFWPEASTFLDTSGDPP